jgi:hypothetical protein
MQLALLSRLRPQFFELAQLSHLPPVAKFLTFATAKGHPLLQFLCSIDMPGDFLSIMVEELCEGLPTSFCNFVSHVHSLDFDRKLDYQYLYSILSWRFSSCGWTLVYAGQPNITSKWMTQMHMSSPCVSFRIDK